MVSIEMVYEGDLHCRAIHGPSRAEFATDAPADNQGRGESFSPTDLVATALGTCILTTMGIAARVRGWDMRGSRASVVKRMVADPARRIGELTVEVQMAGTFDEQQRKVLEHAAHTCPVHKSLHPDVKIPLTFHWG
jgi:putative redox protein